MCFIFQDAVAGTDVVIIPAGIPRKPGMTRDDLFNTNISIVCDIIKVIGQVSPHALVGIISNPVSTSKNYVELFLYQVVV